MKKYVTKGRYRTLGVKLFCCTKRNMCGTQLYNTAWIKFSNTTLTASTTSLNYPVLLIKNSRLLTNALFYELTYELTYLGAVSQ